MAITYKLLLFVETLTSAFAPKSSLREQSRIYGTLKLNTLRHLQRDRLGWFLCILLTYQAPFGAWFL